MGGGIHDSESAARAFSLGADAIQVATRFVTTEECDADIRYKEAYLNARKEDIVIVKSPVGMPGRAILNPFMKKVKELGRIAPAHCFQCLKHCNPGTTPYCITQALINAAKGKMALLNNNPAGYFMSAMVAGAFITLGGFVTFTLGSILTQAVQNGRLAMQDTLGQAAAMTGGYGSSYGQQAAQQAYQQRMDALSDKASQLYDKARTAYDNQGQRDRQM